KVEVLLERVKVELLRPRREPLLQQILRRIGKPHSRPLVDRIPQQPEDVVREVDVMVEREECGHGRRGKGERWRMNRRSGRSSPLHPSSFILHPFIACKIAAMTTSLRLSAVRHASSKRWRNRFLCRTKTSDTSSRMASFSSALNR